MLLRAGLGKFFKCLHNPFLAFPVVRLSFAELLESAAGDNNALAHSGTA
jgi:hypothetical protein